MASAALPLSTLPLRIGARTLWSFRRPLVRTRIGLEQALGGVVPELPALSPCADGYFLNAVPSDALARLAEARRDLIVFERQSYARSYANLAGGFDAWLAGLSAKSRSTLRRKVRRLADRSGGALDLRCYRAPEEMDEFHRLAREVSARTYQEKLLDAGLPDGAAARDRLKMLAATDAVRGWILSVDGRPIAYLHAPAEGDVLIYAHLGYDADFADWSPGTVLQFEAMRELMDEGRFAWFDFTEGDGPHKRLFSTGSIDSVDLLLLRRTIANLLMGSTLGGFDRAVAIGKQAMRRAGIERFARRALR